MNFQHRVSNSVSYHRGCGWVVPRVGVPRWSELARHLVLLNMEQINVNEQQRYKAQKGTEVYISAFTKGEPVVLHQTRAAWLYVWTSHSRRQFDLLLFGAFETVWDDCIWERPRLLRLWQEARWGTRDQWRRIYPTPFVSLYPSFLVYFLPLKKKKLKKIECNCHNLNPQDPIPFPNVWKETLIISVHVV